MNRKISLGAAIAFMLIVATATFSMTMIFATDTFNDKVVALKERENEFEKFSEIDRIVRQKYMGNINAVQLMDSVSQGYIAGLNDPYAMYIDAREYERMLRSQEGTLTGVGAVLLPLTGDGYLTVIEVYADSPAQAEGLQVGDVVVRIDDIDLTPENNAQLLESVQGEAGTRIVMVVRRGAEELYMEMTRRQVVIPTVHSHIIQGTNIGYIWIEEFNDNTSDQFNRELQRMLSAGANAFIFDVRDNRGGSLRQATRILDRLCPDGIMASYTPKNGSQVLYTSDAANQLDMPMVVLVNENSASASELFAQVLRDFDKARVVGVTTAGKGVIQETVQLSDGSAIIITVAELLGPTGETFNVEGVRPDYEVTLGPDENWRDLDEDTDTQLVKAIEVASGMERTSESQTEEPVPDAPDPLAMPTEPTPQ